MFSIYMMKFVMNFAALLGQAAAPFVIFLALVTSEGGEATPRSAITTHPRLFFAESDLSALQAKATTSHVDIWLPISDFSSQTIDLLPPTDAPTDISDEAYRNFGNQLIPLAFACKVSGNTDSCMVAKQSLLRYTYWSQWGANDERGLGLAHMVMGNALAYDWLYSQLSTAEQAQVRVSLGKRAQQLFEASSANTYQESWKNWWRKSYAQNFYTICNSALGMAGLALLNEDPRAEQWTSQAIAQIQKTKLFLDGIKDGSWHEGIGYQSYMLTMMLPFLVNVERIEGQNLFPELYLQNYTYWRIYNNLPEEIVPILAIGDIDSDWGNAYESQNLLRFTAGRYRNQHAQWMAQHLIQTFGRTPDQWSTPWYVFEFLYYDPSVSSQSPEWLPKSRIFWDQESVIWRSSWEHDALIFALKSGAPGGRFLFDSFVKNKEPWASDCLFDTCQLNAGHDHLDSSGFYLYKNGWLTPESAGVGKQATSFHNTMLIDGQGQHEPPGANFWSEPTDFLGSDGFIAMASTVPDFEYVVSDTTRRYKNVGDIQEMTRHVLFVRPNYLLLLDDIRAASPHRYEWVTHLGSSVTVDGAWIQGNADDDKIVGIAVVRPQSFQTSQGNDGQPFIKIRPSQNITNARLIHLLYPTEIAQWNNKPTIQLLEDTPNWNVVRVAAQDGSGQVDEIVLNHGEDAGVGYRFDGDIAVIKKDSNQQLLKLYIAHATQLIDQTSNRTLVNGLSSEQSLEVVYYDDVVALYGSLGGTVEIFAPQAQQVRFNGSFVDFARVGDHIQVCLGQC